LYGATVHASPSSGTNVGRALLKGQPDHPGSLGIAVSEGLEDAQRDDTAIYCLGSVLNHVLLHQTVIGLETKRQFERIGVQPDIRPVRVDRLRYHGCSPILSLLRHLGYIDTIAYPEDERHVFERGRQFVQAEGFLPAPESAYSIACAIDEALKCKEAGEAKVIAFNVSGHGFMDMEGYAQVLGL